MRILPLVIGTVLAGLGFLAASAAWTRFVACARILRSPICQAPCATPSVSQVCSPIGAVFWTYVAVTGAILVGLGAALKSRDELAADALSRMERSDSRGLD